MVVVEESLTGVRAESQRGLEAPGLEIRGSSWQDKRHRQRNKHDPSSCLVLIRCSFAVVVCFFLCYFSSCGKLGFFSHLNHWVPSVVLAFLT